MPDNKYKQLSEYSFPGYALLWRSALERRSSFMSASEEKVFDRVADRLGTVLQGLREVPYAPRGESLRFGTPS